MSEQLITRKKAAELLSVTVKTIDTWLNAKKITRVKFGETRQACCRIKMSEVQKLMNGV